MAGLVSTRLAVIKFPAVPMHRGFLVYIRVFSLSDSPCSCIRINLKWLSINQHPYKIVNKFLYPILNNSLNDEFFFMAYQGSVT